ncbi:MAG: sugar ABC transporter ATP-binding protein, partial [Bdellovibrionales bacterium]|nr:sugar ABC transporter ATP-binding protein [Bdellovibrionales bacterium]
MSLQAKQIVKNFGGVKALKGVSFEVKPGEIHALCGENGAGKSTLMKIFAGHYPWGTFGGSLEIDGVEQKFAGLEFSRRAGISIVFQELSLAPDLTVEENLNLGRESVLGFGILDHSALRTSALKALEQVGLKVDLCTDVASLSIGVQQLIEIAKAVVSKPRFLILDEPTSALSETEIGHFLKLIRSFADAGMGCVLISHKLDEVFQVSDRITVLRDGESLGTFLKADLSEAALVKKMVGREVQTLFPSRKRVPGKTILKVKGLTVPNPKHPERHLVENISFEIRAGEIVGLSGLMGAGRSEAALGLLGGMKRSLGLEVELEGRSVSFSTTAEWVNAGVVIATEDRKKTGLALQMSIRENLSLSSLARFARRGFVNNESELAECLKMIRAIGVKCESVVEPVQNLSGGN